MSGVMRVTPGLPGGWSLHHTELFGFGGSHSPKKADHSSALGSSSPNRGALDMPGRCSALAELEHALRVLQLKP